MVLNGEDRSFEKEDKDLILFKHLISQGYYGLPQKYFNASNKCKLERNDLHFIEKFGL